MGPDIVLTGVRQNNLKDVSLRIPAGKLTVFTGVSGSGKSSIVFGTIAVESQRQLNETFPAFVRNRLPKHERPKAEAIENLSAAIVVDQRPVGGNARSTVGTMTEIQTMLRVLFSRYGTPPAGPATAYSFNDPLGMCPGCDGLGRTVTLDLDRLIDEDRSLNEGAIRFPAFAVGTAAWQLYAESGPFDPGKPVRDFTAEERELLLYGGGFRVERASRRGVYQNEYEGVAARMERLYLKRDKGAGKSGAIGAALADVAHRGTCPACGGARLNRAALASRIDGANIADYAALEVTDLIAELEGLDRQGNPVAAAALPALRRVEDIGLGYLSLDRETSTLSGGEGQRLKTVRHLGSSLVGMTYIFDEPSVGLHPRDVHRLGDLLLALRDKGEHGPGGRARPGRHGAGRPCGRHGSRLGRGRRQSGVRGSAQSAARRRHDHRQDAARNEVVRPETCAPHPCRQADRARRGPAQPAEHNRGRAHRCPHGRHRSGRGRARAP